MNFPTAAFIATIVIYLGYSAPPSRNPANPATSARRPGSYWGMEYVGSGINYLGKMMTRSVELVNKSIFSDASQEQKDLEMHENSVLISTADQLKTSAILDLSKCPKKFTEPSGLPGYVVRDVTSGLERLVNVGRDQVGGGYVEIFGDYVVAREIVEFKAYPLVCILFRAPVQFGKSHTPKLQQWYHRLTERTLPRVGDFIRSRPINQQYIFAGVGDGAGLALLHAWRIHGSNVQINQCGRGTNRLNQITVMMFGGYPTVTSFAMKGFKLRHKNVLFFKKESQVGSFQPMGFDRIGLKYDIRDSETKISALPVSADEAERTVSRETDWQTALVKGPVNEVLQLAAVKLGLLHSKAAYYLNTSEGAFKKQSYAHLHRDFYSCAEHVTEALLRTTSLTAESVPTVTCDLIDPSYDMKTAGLKCSLETVYNKIPFKVPFVEYDISVNKNPNRAEEMIDNIPIGGSVDPGTPEKWNTCLRAVFKDSILLGSFDPFNKSQKLPFQFTKLHSGTLSTCVARIRSTTEILYNMYKYLPSAFFQLFASSGRFKSSMPAECIGQIQPMVIPETDKGNGDEWFKATRRFITDLSNVVKPETKQLHETDGFTILHHWGSVPLDFPSCLQPLLPTLYACMTERTVTDLVDCRIAENRKTGKGRCPEICDLMHDPPYTCSRIKSCGDRGIFLGFRGDGYSPINSARQSFERDIQVTDEFGEFLYLKIQDKAVGQGLFSYKTVFYLTIFVDRDATVRFNHPNNPRSSSILCGSESISDKSMSPEHCMSQEQTETSTAVTEEEEEEEDGSEEFVTVVHPLTEVMGEVKESEASPGAAVTAEAVFLQNVQMVHNYCRTNCKNMYDDYMCNGEDGEGEGEEEGEGEGSAELPVLPRSDDD